MKAGQYCFSPKFTQLKSNEMSDIRLKRQTNTKLNDREIVDG